MVKNDIGINAGVIWHLLADKGAVSIFGLRKHSDIKATDVFLALGWLAREDKIRFFEKEGEIYVELKNQFSEMFL